MASRVSGFFSECCLCISANLILYFMYVNQKLSYKMGSNKVFLNFWIWIWNQYTPQQLRCFHELKTAFVKGCILWWWNRQRKPTIHFYMSSLSCCLFCIMLDNSANKSIYLVTRNCSMVLLCNDVSHWLGASLESALCPHINHTLRNWLQKIYRN